MMKQIISLQIDDSQLICLKKIAEDKDMSVSALIRMMIKNYLKEYSDETRVSKN